MRLQKWPNQAKKTLFLQSNQVLAVPNKKLRIKLQQQTSAVRILFSFTFMRVHICVKFSLYFRIAVRATGGWWTSFRPRINSRALRWRGGYGIALLGVFLTWEAGGFRPYDLLLIYKQRSLPIWQQWPLRWPRFLCLWPPGRRLRHH